MSPKLPFMPFYGTDFYESERVCLMKPAEEGIYLRLLWRQWREGSLPEHEVELARVARVKKISEIVVMCFPVDADGRRRNPKLEAIRAEHVAIQEQKSKAGKARWEKERSADAAHEQRTSGGHAELVEPEPEPDKKNSLPHGRNGRVKQRGPPTWLSPFAKLWVIGTPPFGQLAKEMKPLVDQHGEADVLVRWTRYLKHTDPKFWSPHRFANTYNAWNADDQYPGLTDEPNLEWVN